MRAGIPKGGRRRVELVLNECHAYSYSPDACERYMTWYLAQPDGRVKHFGAEWPFTLVAITCDDRDHAEWLRVYFISLGIPKRSMKIRKAA